eukprot:TRINITY_DN9725_c0_g2_i2.p1 TRINITY_DN9725_c0_g2~~TRINITY_DN9725_c0_g2_i2.p1  ORF type:complete len:506 (+),score=151.82 TRINITY_DN9725_c0_g2_i2:49-1566(+)
MKRESSNSEEFDMKTRRRKQELKDEIMLDLIEASPDLSPLHRTVICSLIEGEIKHRLKSKDSHFVKAKHDSKEPAEEYYDYEEINKFVKQFMTSKEELIRMVEIGMDSLKAMRLQTFLIFDGRLHKSLVNKITRLIKELRKHEGANNEAVALDFWAKMVKRDQKKTKRKIKELVMKVLYYKFEEAELAYQRAVHKILTRVLERLWRFAWASHRAKLAEKLNKANDEPSPTNKEESKDLSAKSRKNEHRGRQIAQISAEEDEQANETLEEISEWNRRTIKEMFRKKAALKNIQLVMSYLAENQGAIDTCFEVTKEVVEVYFKEQNLLSAQNECLLANTIAKAVCESVYLSEGKEKTKEHFAEFANKYLKGCFVACDKAVIKRYKKTFNQILLMSSIKDENILHIAFNWGAIMCGQKNAKCSRGVCIEFAKEWTNSFVPIIAEALKVLQGLMPSKDSAKESKHKTLLTYLQMHCFDAKFNKEHFENFLNECKERMKKLAEKLKAQKI